MRVTALSMTGVLLFATGCSTPGKEEFRLAESHRRLADAKLAKGEIPYAVREYRAAIEVFPDDPESYYGLGVALMRKGHLADAREMLREAIRLEPNHHEARLNVGVSYLAEEDWSNAITVFRALSEDPAFLRPERALVNLGWALYKSGNLDASKQAFLLALGENRTNYIAHLDLGIVYYDQGELLDAIRAFEAADEILGRTRRSPQFLQAKSEVLFRMAQAHVKLGKRDRAVDQLRRASEAGGDSEWARKSREYLAVLE